MTDVIQIDGSQGEGGGQIVRSSLALSMVTGLPFSIEKVRAGRERPGLMRQHLTAVQAARQICSATVVGDVIGSDHITFHPGTVRPGDYHFAIGTAGSAALVLQTVLPPLLLADGPSRLVMEGGTHNPWAPSYDFLERAFLPLVQRMGPRVASTIERYGFYPAGGGRFVVTIEPQRHPQAASRTEPSLHQGHLEPLDLLERGEIKSRRGRALLSNLPAHIAERECQELLRLAKWSDGHPVCETVSAVGPGNAVLIEIVSEHITEMFVAIGEYGVSAETVVRRAIDELRAYLVSDVPVGRYLADQLLLPQAISVWLSKRAGGPRSASFRTTRLSNHSLTHIDVIKAFLRGNIEVQQEREAFTVLLT